MAAVTKEILSRLDALAAKIGQTAALLWPHAVRYVAIEAAASVCFAILVFLIGSTMACVGCYYGKQKNWKDGGWIAPVMIGGILAGVSILYFAVSGTTDIAIMLEPTGYLVRTALRH